MVVFSHLWFCYGCGRISLIFAILKCQGIFNVWNVYIGPLGLLSSSEKVRLSITTPESREFFSEFIMWELIRLHCASFQNSPCALPEITALPEFTITQINSQGYENKNAVHPNAVELSPLGRTAYCICLSWKLSLYTRLTVPCSSSLTLPASQSHYSTTESESLFHQPSQSYYSTRRVRVTIPPAESESLFQSGAEVSQLT